MNHYKHTHPTPADRRAIASMGELADRRSRVRHTLSDRVVSPVRRPTPPPPASDPGGFMFVVIGGSLAICLVALAIALLSQ